MILQVSLAYYPGSGISQTKDAVNKNMNRAAIPRIGVDCNREGSKNEDGVGLGAVSEEIKGCQRAWGHFRRWKIQ